MIEILSALIISCSSIHSEYYSRSKSCIKRVIKCVEEEYDKSGIVVKPSKIANICSERIFP